MRALVTGASGLIGRHAVEAFQADGVEVRTFHRSGALPHAEHVAGDVRADRALLRDAAAGCEAVVHLAGEGDVAASRRDPVGYADLNATGALHAVDAARAAGAAFLLASTQRVYRLRPEPCREDDAPAPDSPYGYAKWVAELWGRMAAEQFGVPTTVLRFFSVYGPGQQPNGQSGVVTIFARAALAGAPLTVQSNGRRDFTDVRDVARGIVLAARSAREAPYRLLNVATGAGTSFADLARLVVTCAGSSSEILNRPVDPPGKDLVADVARARQALGYEPRIPLAEGVAHYLAWLRNADSRTEGPALAASQPQSAPEV